MHCAYPACGPRTRPAGCEVAVRGAQSARPPDCARRVGTSHGSGALRSGPRYALRARCALGNPRSNSAWVRRCRAPRGATGRRDDGRRRCGVRTPARTLVLARQTLAWGRTGPGMRTDRSPGSEPGPGESAAQALWCPHPRQDACAGRDDTGAGATMPVWAPMRGPRPGVPCAVVLRCALSPRPVRRPGVGKDQVRLAPRPARRRRWCARRWS